MSRDAKSTVLVTIAIALVASLAIHVPIYGALGILAKMWKDDEAQQQPAPVTVDFEVGEPSEPTAGPPDQQTPEGEPEEGEAAEEQARTEPPERPRPERRRRHRAEPEPEPEPEQEAVAEVEVQPPPPAEQRNLQAIQQHSQNPEVEAPENPRFISEENNRVEEETVARLRNYQRDDQEQSAGRPNESSDAEEPGNDSEQELADARDMEGSDQRDATEEEARADRPRHAPERPLPNVASRGNTAREGAAESASGDARSRQGGEHGGATASGGGEPRERVVEVSDGVGTFRIAVREPRPEGQGAGDGGGEARPGAGSGDRGAGNRAGAPGSGRHGERGRGRGTGREGPDLRVSWSQFEEVYDEDELRREREAWVEERRSRLRGSNRGQRWREFRAAIENFVPNVRPGNQTALNAAASPFANYIAHVHRRIHRQFADRFLAGLPAGGTSPFADRTLNTKLEIILNRDGSVHRIGIVKTSGFLPFDHGAWTAVMNAQPFPEAPTQILSGDGKVYMHWGFYRNERQCGTFNAEPYILPHPPGSPSNTGPFRDQGGVIPDDAHPTWGTDAEREGNNDAPAPDPDEHDDAPANHDGAPPPSPPRNAPDIPPGSALG